MTDIVIDSALVGVALLALGFGIAALAFIVLQCRS